MTALVLTIIACAVVGNLFVAACYLIAAAILNWAHRRREFNDARRETESLTAMLAGDRRTGDVLSLRAKGP